MTNGSEFPDRWNGTPIPPRPPLPNANASQEPPVTPEKPKFKIGMPPGMDVHLDTVPSTDVQTPVTVSKPEFGPAPTPFGRPPVPGVPAAPATRAAPAANPRLVLPDGAVLPLAQGLIVGRDPQHQDGYGVSALAPLHDVERSVSKTHAVLGVSEGRVWVIDLNSTNGTFLIAPDGSTTPCPPEVATPLIPGADIRFGEYRVRVALD
ncbi:hypothetical protein L1277_000060 [Okibacterium sp. HSC-33S16]|uniref:FHA domain-containing protein n=1 Tax=Okibacterium sp. HSC-33S16 TaxID=2910965 RepID=UPI00209D5935|nr:FHA domain-containing protein [Okibacterium sp. HSC-33S16]MCP2029996.1 hypothetical protein [Okibacterium sp. HSC-33S16]